MKRARDKKPYFAEREEQAVLDYILTGSGEIKNKIYNEILIEPFRKMIQSILRRYPIHIGNYDMDEVEQNALTHLVDHMVKYKPYIIERKNGLTDKWDKLPDGVNGFRFIFVEDARVKLTELIESDDGREYRLFEAKAFSYCQTIIRNYYKDHGRKSYSEKKINVCYDDFQEEINQNIEYTYEMENDGQSQLEVLIETVTKKIDDKIMNDPNIKRNEAIVGDAIINILKNWNTLFMEETPEGRYNKKVTNKFAKNKILLFLKEQTGLSTKEIRLAIKPFKEIYFVEKMDFFND